MRHIIDLSSLSQEEFDGLYRLASDIIDHPADFADACAGKVLGSLFYEPSTRTNLSFSTAMMRLGGNVVGFSDPSSSSAAKGESLKDTISMVSSYADMIVMRNPWEGAAQAAALYSSVPVINAGDGGHLHPTQTLTDMTTILRLRGSADNMCVGICGDLKYGRTVHSLIKFLARYQNVQFYLIAPRELAVPSYIRQFMIDHHMKFYEVSGLDPVIPMLDVLYMTRIQRERFPTVEEYNSLKGIYCLNQSKLWHAKRDLLIMHPLPRVDEIAQDVDDDPRAVYFEQAKIGMYARMALLLTLSRQPSVRPRRPRAGQPGIRCTNPKCITNAETYLPMYQVASGDELCCIYCDKPTERVEKD